MNSFLPQNEIYILLNKVLNTLVRREFGKQYSIRLNSLCFIANRTDVFYFYTCCDKITIKSSKPIKMNELILIKEFLLIYINSALMCIDTKSYIEVVDIELVII